MRVRVTCKRTLHKSHVLLTAVRFVTINSVLALILSLHLNQNRHPTKAGNKQWSAGGLTMTTQILLLQY